MARSDWTPTSGKVIAREIARTYGSGNMAADNRWKYVVEFSLDSGEPKRAELKQVWGLIGKKMINPPEGDKVPLLVNRRTGKVRFDVKDPAINWKASYKADKAKEKAKFKRELKG